jgi:tetratricopeptide (TPR) repeat protein
VLKLQTEIATAVASALKVSLLGDEAAKIELGGTRNPAAFDAYLRGMSAYRNYHDGNDLRLAVARYTDAIRLDPSYALAYAGRSQAGHLYIDEFGAANEAGADAGAVRADALKAITLAPGLAEGHLALAQFLDTFAQDFTQASSEYERAVTLAPGNAQVLAIYAMSSVRMGRAEPGIAAARRAVALDPLSALTRRTLARSLFSARHYDEAIAASDETSSLNPDDAWAAADRGLSYYLLGDLERARASCEIALQHFQVQVCRAIVYQRLGRRPEAQAEVAAMRIAIGDSAAYQYVQVYAQWGNAPKALGWLDTAARLRDTGLKNLKSDPLVDPLRNEPRFQAIERALRFPD